MHDYEKLNEVFCTETNCYNLENGKDKNNNNWFILECEIETNSGKKKIEFNYYSMSMHEPKESAMTKDFRFKNCDIYEANFFSSSENNRYLTIPIHTLLFNCKHQPKSLTITKVSSITANGNIKSDKANYESIEEALMCTGEMKLNETILEHNGECNIEVENPNIEIIDGDDVTQLNNFILENNSSNKLDNIVNDTAFNTLENMNDQTEFKVNTVLETELCDTRLNNAFKQVLFNNLIDYKLKEKIENNLLE
jgi:hypothetical protein